MEESFCSGRQVRKMNEEEVTACACCWETRQDEHLHLANWSSLGTWTRAVSELEPV